MESSRLAKLRRASFPHHGETVCDRTYVSGALCRELAILAVPVRECDAVGRHAPRASLPTSALFRLPGIFPTLKVPRCT